MPAVDWRSSDPYERLETADAPTFAGEFLARNPDFQDDIRRLTGRLQGDQPPEETGETGADAFEQRWGCEFGRELLSWPVEPRWTLTALPSRILVIETPPQLRTAAAPLDLSRITSRLTGSPTFFIEVDPPGVAGSFCSVVIPLDRLIDVRVVALRQLVSVLVDRSPGPSPFALSRARRYRLMAALRALDGRQAGASYRAIATALFGQRTLPERAWKTHDLRDRTIRLVRYGQALMRGGYRQLLLHPHRGKL